MFLHVVLSHPRACFDPCLLLAFLCVCSSLFGQRHVPYMDSSRDSGFAQIDFAQIYMNQQAWDDAERDSNRQSLADSGSVSALDLRAPAKAIKQFNHGAAGLREQRPKDAILCFKKAVSLYPEFVSAHVGLGMAYFDEKDDRAKDEFKNATILDDQFPLGFFDLGTVQLLSHDYADAESNLQKAADLTPRDPKSLTLLAYAQNRTHHYDQSLQTAQRVHALDHKGMARVHYIAMASALSLHDMARAENELNRFLAEDPTNPLVPVARQHMDAVRESHVASSEVIQASDSITLLQTFPNSEYLHAELGTVDKDGAANCGHCLSQPDPIPVSSNTLSREASIPFADGRKLNDLFTIRRDVDETALFFSVTRHGHLVNDLSVADLKVRDNNTPPERILELIPQSQLPLRLGLMVDTSDSVENRAPFEKQAARKFLQRMISVQSDLAFVAGFNSSVSVAQDFTADPNALAAGAENLGIRGTSTSIFDAIEYGCWKLAAYPDEERVAKVLVILTDGEDNSSHRSLRQTIEFAQEAGVTVYTVNSGIDLDTQTDAARILKTIAEGTGGEAMFPETLRDLDRYLSKLPELIRSRYLIAYRPAHFVPDGKYRSVQISAAKDGKPLRVRTRRGYYARLADK